MTHQAREEIWIVSGKRTAFGSFGGSLKNMSATDLAVVASRGAMVQADVSPRWVDHVIFGNVIQTSDDAIYLPRHVGLKAGIPIETPALGVNRLCGSGFQAAVSAGELILTGQAEVVLAGGTESMSQAPHLIRGARWGTPLGNGILEDSLAVGLTDSWPNLPMGMTAENLAVDYGLTQDQVDTYSVGSQQRFAAAQSAGKLEAEIVPIEVKNKKGAALFRVDEHNRPATTLGSLKKLPKVFKVDGVIHAGAASGISDGAAAMVVTSKRWAESQHIRPLGRLVDWATVGCEPSRMGIGPAVAIRKLLQKTRLGLDDIDLIEVNEAFAPQYLAVEQELGLPRDRTNVNGGAIAVGHPLGASGARIIVHLLYELKRRKGRYGIGSACIGGGQGMAVLVESL